MAENQGARVLVITGAGRGFCAGQDLADPAVAPGTDLREALEERYNPLVRRIAKLPMPVVAAVNGSCRRRPGPTSPSPATSSWRPSRPASSRASANIGLIPDSGGTWILPRIAGQARALGDDAHRHADLRRPGRGLGTHLALRRRQQARRGDRRPGCQVRRRPDPGSRRDQAADPRKRSRGPLKGALDDERDAQSKLGRSADYAEGVEAFAAQAAAEKFTGRFRGERQSQC